MGTSYNPKIVTDGLVLCLDAINAKSYKNTTIWYDISGNNNNGTMFGAIPTSTDGLKCFDFSTVTGATSASASLGFTFALNMIQTTGSFTLSTWIKNPPVNAGQCGMFSNAGGGSGYRFGVGLNGIYWLIGPAYQEGQSLFNTGLDAAKWYNVVAVFDRAGTYNAGAPILQLYLNGVFQSNVLLNAPQTAFPNVAPGLVKSACCGVYTGKLATFSAYNKALSATEIQQNFNALRGRYGI